MGRSGEGAGLARGITALDPQHPIECLKPTRSERVLKYLWVHPETYKNKSTLGHGQRGGAIAGMHTGLLGFVSSGATGGRGLNTDPHCSPPATRPNET